MILLLIILLGFAVGWRFGRHRSIVFVPALAFAVLQVGHLALSAMTNTLGQSTLLPILLGFFWLGATGMGATISTRRVTL